MLLKLPRRPRPTPTDSLFSFLFFGRAGDQRLPASRLANTKHPCFWLSPGASSLVYPSFWRPYLWTRPVFCTRKLHPASITFVQTDFGEKLFFKLLFVVRNHFYLLACSKTGNCCQCEQGRHFILTSLGILKGKKLVTNHQSISFAFTCFFDLSYK